MIFNNIDTKATFNNKYFQTSENMKNATTTEDESTMSEFDDTVYPMYLPSGTYLSTEETVKLDDGERIILTFQGESPFILVEETTNIKDEYETIQVSGEPTILLDSIGALSENSVNFISNGIEYYIASESMTMQEMYQVAESINSIPVMK